MAIPQKAAFEASLKYLRTCNAGILKPLFKLDVFNGSSSVDGLSLTRLALSVRQEKHDEADRDEVISWLNSQDAYVRATNKLGSKSNGQPDQITDEELDDEARLYFERFTKIVTIENPVVRQQRFDRHVRDLLGTSFRSISGWHWGLVHALHEYYYTDAVSKILNNRSQLNSKIDTAIDGLMALKKIDEDAFAASQFDRMQFVSLSKKIEKPPHIDIVDKQLESRIRLLEALKKIDLDVLYPLSRGDRTAKERLFVYRMWRCNTLAFRGSKTPLIACLMELDGFQKQLEERNIGKQCAEFKMESRQLFDEFSKITDMSENTENSSF